MNGEVRAAARACARLRKIRCDAMQRDTETMWRGARACDSVQRTGAGYGQRPGQCCIGACTIPTMQRPDPFVPAGQVHDRYIMRPRCGVGCALVWQVVLPLEFALTSLSHSTLPLLRT